MVHKTPPKQAMAKVENAAEQKEQRQVSVGLAVGTGVGSVPEAPRPDALVCEFLIPRLDCVQKLPPPPPYLH